MVQSPARIETSTLRLARSYGAGILRREVVEWIGEIAIQAVAK